MIQPTVKEPDAEKILGAIVKKGPAEYGDHKDDHDRVHAHPLDWKEFARVLFVGAAAGALWFVGRSMNPYIIAIGVICTVVGGFPIFHEAYENIAQRRMTMELSMAIAIVAALAIRELFAALVITLFVLIAEILEGLTVGRGRKAIQHLVDLLPSVATVRRSGAWTDVEIREVSTDDEVLVRPGGRIPVDGKVVGGHSFVDQAPITGESMPVEKQAGAIVYAGTINQSRALEVRVERLGRDTSFGKIIEAVETAEKSRNTSFTRFATLRLVAACSRSPEIENSDCSSAIHSPIPELPLTRQARPEVEPGVRAVSFQPTTLCKHMRSDAEWKFSWKTRNPGSCKFNGEHLLA
jgi:cation transport ATPase